MSQADAHWLTIGRISGVHGVRGWVKVHSYTQPAENIVEYQPWRLTGQGREQTVVAVDTKFSGKVLLVALEGITDRDQALALQHMDIQVTAEQLPTLAGEEYYWYQLEGLRVVSQFKGKQVDLGKVHHLLETGANDVLVVKGDSKSIDTKERLLPYLRGQTINKIDLDEGVIEVDWDPEF